MAQDPNAKPANKPSGDRNLSDIFGRDVTVVRGSITNERSGESFEFFFNPPAIEEVYEAEYDMQSPMGMSHGYHQFKANKNVPVTFEIYYNRMLVVQELRNDVPSNERFDLAVEKGEEGRKFLISCLYPPDPEPQTGPSEGIIGAAPPPLRLNIGNVLSLRVRLITCHFRYARFDKLMRPMIWTAQLKFDEAPISRITMEAARDLGSFR